MGPSGSNAGCAFTGLIDVKNAIAQYSEGAAWCCPKLHGTRYLTLGGGNSAGEFTSSALKDIASSAAVIKQAGYSAVMFDVEEIVGSSDLMIPLFQESFAALKKAGLIVAVTTSHSAPYQCDSAADAVAITKAWIADANIDILSPQLYSSGQEGTPEFAETNSCKNAGCTWELYKGAKAVIAPSIVDSSQYAAVKEWFSTKLGISTRGYFQWSQVAGHSHQSLMAALPSEIIGYYSWNWGSGSVGPSGSNAGCAF